MRQTVVRILKNWDYPDWRRLTPGGSGVWDGIQFTEDPVDSPDYVLVLNQPAADVELRVAPNRVWAVIQEPPTPFHRFLHRGQPSFARIYTTDPDLVAGGGRYVFSQPGLPWHVDRSFDELTAPAADLPKRRAISWVTSTLAFLPVHQRRMAFLDRIRSSGRVELFGRGLRPVADKWDALAPFRYSIVFENHSGPGYWSEKLADCFLAGTMPIYFGATDIDRYFPRDSFIRLDPNADDPVGVLDRILAEDPFENSRNALSEARIRCLQQYHVLAVVAAEICADMVPPLPSETVRIENRKEPNTARRLQAAWYFKIRPQLARRKR